MPEIRICQTTFCESLPNRISTESMEGSTGYAENSINGPTQSRLYYLAIWHNSELPITQQILNEVFHINFQQYLRNGLLDTRKSPLMPQDENWNFPTTFSKRLPHRNVR
jgi:hypothetical protein